MERHLQLLQMRNPLSKKTVFVCFSDRRVSYSLPDSSILCPDCREEMTDQGRDFKPPRAGQIQKWRRAQQLAEHKRLCYSLCLCEADGPKEKPRPNRLRFYNRKIKSFHN